MNGDRSQSGATPEFVLLTGSLGSGKTTLLKDYLSLPDSEDTAVIVNEAGEINIDGAIIVSGRRDLPLALLSNGCVCCSVGNDLHAAIDELVSVRRRTHSAGFRRIVLETSGLALPGPVLRSLMAYGRGEFRIRIVSTLDPLNPMADEALLPIQMAQLTAAQSIVFTKLDLADAAGRSALERTSVGYNPTANRIAIADRHARARAVFAPAQAEPRRRHGLFEAMPATAHPRLQVFLAEWPQPVRWPDLRDWLEDLAGFCGDRLLRVKGLVSVSGVPQPLLIEGIGGVFSEPRRIRLETPTDEGVVIIARDISLDELSAFNKSCSAGPPSLRLSRGSPYGAGSGFIHSGVRQ
jgi:G3E family GTPase